MHHNPTEELIRAMLIGMDKIEASVKRALQEPQEPQGPPCGICGSHEGVDKVKQENGPTWLLCDNCFEQYSDADLQEILWDRREEEGFVQGGHPDG